MICKNCGIEMAENVKFCSNCGTKVVSEQPQIQQVENNDLIFGNSSSAVDTLASTFSQNTKVNDGQQPHQPIQPQVGNNNVTSHQNTSQLSPQNSASTYSEQFNTTGNTTIQPIRFSDNSNNNNNSNNNVKAIQGNGMSVASLILGILSLVVCYAGTVMGILAIIFGAISLSKKKQNNGKAVAGLIMGIIGIVFWIVVVVIILALGAGAWDSWWRFDVWSR